ncbi:MAG: hypothetical protein AUK47_12190 [Deltaproteobacteria bacterium CG2_30_63_29]|nr:MAG: hypothetical protein AUK47_12190 [Deltaproteobacteria bacterium CG2_30_63_29]PIV99851.1 MAG: heat-shock protein Hsp70 [Deltaproteobacteria bacterium CG17_big_fil_post_rev_8_21_14_2_50_63_7]PJB36079.1 MAG: heat-shock protein Hsp70 [Deltaproteobacteria bacterium CG_4_9_14_3_um_filter_63_12]
MKDIERVVGIDLGTTNSAVAGVYGGHVVVLGRTGEKLLPSVVGLSPSGEMLIGQSARNQAVAFPERTISSIKRKMGTSEPVRLGELELRPQEVSALLLKALKERAEIQLGGPVEKAVITVPAYFSDAQRQATREAGVLAGLEVLRILNEPTAASFAYGHEGDGRHLALIYDLGGGTFDVSVVCIEGDVTEVLASHGDNHLGGDDFDLLVRDLLCDLFWQAHRVKLTAKQHSQALARLRWAAEAARIELSDAPYARVQEESLIVHKGVPLHLDVELSRETLEELIAPLLERTLESVTKALSDANVSANDLDAVLLVGGTTRTPMVARLLREASGMEPSTAIHADLCVALGAGVLASRLAGHKVDKVLVDVTPYSFGPSYLGWLRGVESENCYKPIIVRNSPLPLAKTDSYFTSSPNQTVADIFIYQGEEPDALNNLEVGRFSIEGLRPMFEANEILVRMELDINGILSVSAMEKETGLSKKIVIERAFRSATEAELAGAFENISALYARRPNARNEAIQPPVPVPNDDPRVEVGSSRDGAPRSPEENKAERVMERARALETTLHADDWEEARGLLSALEKCLTAREFAEVITLTAELEELLFFIEGA